ncbi:hypothetical protein, partial [Methylorubrum aminovorans]
DDNDDAINPPVDHRQRIRSPHLRKPQADSARSATALMRTGNNPCDFAFEIADEAGHVLWHIPFTEPLQ